MIRMPPFQSESDVRQAVMQIVATQTGVSPPKLTDSTRLVEDLHQDGDDVEDIVELVAKTFDIDLSSYRWYHHHGSEGCNPLWLIVRPWRAGMTHIPLRIADLIDAARTRVWPIVYPDEEKA